MIQPSSIKSLSKKELSFRTNRNGMKNNENSIAGLTGKREEGVMDINLEKFLFNLNTLAELGEEMASPKGFCNNVKSALYMVMGSFFASKGIVFGYDRDKKIFSPLSSKGMHGVNEISLQLPEEAIKEFVKYNKPFDIRGGDPVVSVLGPARAELEKFHTRIITFLVIGNELLGLIAISDKFSGEEYTAYDFQLLSIMAQHISFSFHSHLLLKKLMHKYSENKNLCENLVCAYYDTIHAFAAAIDAKDAYTRGHSYRVSSYSSALAREMGLSKEEVEGIRIAGLLHDIGKVAVDKSIINKASSLTKYEWSELYSHPVVGYEILSKIKFPWKGIQVTTRNHHEKMDGSGYPDRLKKLDIPMSARIMALADAFDAMTTDRPYRRRLTFVEAMDQIKENLNKQFDPDIVHTFISIVRKEVRNEVNNPSIIPLLHDQLDLVFIEKLFKDFTKIP